MTKQPDPVDRDEAPGVGGGTPLPFDPGGKTSYTAEEIDALFAGLPAAGNDNNRTVLAAHPDRPATREELLAFVEEMWELYRAESEPSG